MNKIRTIHYGLIKAMVRPIGNYVSYLFTPSTRTKIMTSPFQRALALVLLISHTLMSCSKNPMAEYVPVEQQAPPTQNPAAHSRLSSTASNPSNQSGDHLHPVVPSKAYNPNQLPINQAAQPSTSSDDPYHSLPTSPEFVPAIQLPISPTVISQQQPSSQPTSVIGQPSSHQPALPTLTKALPTPDQQPIPTIPPIPHDLALGEMDQPFQQTTYPAPFIRYSPTTPYAATAYRVNQKPTVRSIQPNSKHTIAPSAQNRLAAHQRRARILRIAANNNPAQQPIPTNTVVITEQPTSKRQYQLARRLQTQPANTNNPTNSIPFTESVTITTREGHQVTFIPVDDHWRAIVRENCPPGFSRTLNLPLLYPQGPYQQATPDPRYTVEYLQTALQTLQHRWVHVVIPKSQETGYVYTGPMVGLLGGCKKFFFYLGVAIITMAVGAILVGTAVGGVAWLLGASAATILKAAGIGAVVGGVVGGISFTAWLISSNSFKISVNNTEDFLDEEGPKILQEIDTIIQEKIDGNALAYKGGTRKKIIESIEEKKRFIQKELDKLDESRKKVEREAESFWAAVGQSISAFFTGPLATSENLEKYEAVMKKGRKIMQEIDEKKKKAIGKLRDQAVTALNKDREDAKKETDELDKELDSAVLEFRDPIDPEYISSIKIQLGKLDEQICKNKQMYEDWKTEWNTDPKLDVPSLSDDLAMINKYIQWEETALECLGYTRDLISYLQGEDLSANNQADKSRQNHPTSSERENTKKENLDTFRQLNQDIKEVMELGKLTNNFKSSIQEAPVCLLHYAIKHKKMPVNTPDEFKYTCLHLAAENNNKEAVEMLLMYGASKNIKNVDGMLPIDLTNDPVIKKLLKNND